MTDGGGRKLVIVGAGEFGSMAYEYFCDDSSYEVCGFASEARYRKADEFMGLPFVDFEALEDRFPPADFDAFVAITYVQLNAERKRLFEECRSKGYRIASYISSSAFVGRGVEVLPGAFVMEGCSLQRHVRIGNGAVVWGGCVIAHQTSIHDFSWVAPGVSTGGFSSIGQQCFIGVGTAIADNVAVPEQSVVGAGSVVTKSISDRASAFAGNPLVKLDESVYARFVER